MAGKKFYIFGAGDNGKQLFDYLGGALAFIDNDIQKHNTLICGIDCISICEAITRGAQDSMVLVSINKNDEIERQLRENHFKHIFWCWDWLRERKYFKPVVKDKNDYKYAVPFNNYESPYPDIIEIHEKESYLFDKDKEVLDIDFNVDRQLALLKEMEQIELPGWLDRKHECVQNRYYYDNGWFGKGSADALYYILRIVKPKAVIEVGSGFSTAVMLDTNEKYFNNNIEIISIEPNSGRLKSLIKPGDNISIYEKNLQDISPVFFEKLNKNDILFIDSSHVSRMNSDVNYIFFEILPRLRSGVYIHFHDIMYPFIYPRKWIYEGRAYNEMYVLRAFLMNNKDYAIQFFGEMLALKFEEKFAEKLQGCGSASIWIKKV